MRGQVVSVLMALCTALAAPAATEPIEKGTLEFSGIVGAALPIEDLADVATTGASVGGSFGYYLSPTACIGVAIVYNDFGVDEAFEEEGVDANYSITEFAASWKSLARGSNSVHPYGRGVVGIFRSTASASADVFGTEIDVSASESDVGIGAGFGMQLHGQGTVGGFLEALVFLVFTEDETSNYVGLRGGLSFFVMPRT
jgi:hypothetical protein